MAKPKRVRAKPRPIVPYEPKGYEPKRISQRIRSEDLYENLDLDPKYVPIWYVDNVIQRVFARMVGQSATGPKVVKCTEDGSLAMVAKGGAFSRYLVLTGTGTDAGATVDLGQQVSRIDLFTYDNAANYKLSRDLVVPLGDVIELFKDSFYSLDVYTRRIWVQNKTPGANCRYRFIGWYD